MACDSKQSGRLGEERGTKVDIPASSAAVGGRCVAGQGSAEPIPGEVPRGGSLTADQAERYEEEGYLVLPDLPRRRGPGPGARRDDAEGRPDGR